MVIVHRSRVGKKETGGHYKQTRSKRVFEAGSRPTETLVSDKDVVKVEKAKAGGLRTKVLYARTVNLFDPKTKTYSKAAVKTVAECAANRQYVRRNVIVKGAIVTTEKGKARVTSRPGQDGTVNAILIS